MNQPFDTSEVKLPYPTRPLEVHGGTVEEYIIPDEKRAEVLDQLYPFDPVPELTGYFFCPGKTRKNLVMLLSPEG
jgi:hypothetical protein